MSERDEIKKLILNFISNTTSKPSFF